MPELSQWEEELVRESRVARMATVDEKNNPHVVVIVYAFDGKRLFTPIDEKPKKDSSKKLRRIRNIENNRAVTVLVDQYNEDWSRLAWVQVRGRADILTDGRVYEKGISLLNEKYMQYSEMRLDDKPLIVVHPTKIVSWRADS